MTTLAGTGTASYSGDNGDASSATLSSPYGVAVDKSGTQTYYILKYYFITLFAPLDNVYIADTSNHRIRMVTVSTGIISMIAGTGTASYSGDNGQASSATLSSPYGVAVDTSGKKTY